MEKRKAIIRDLTTGSVPRTLISFSLPLFLSGLLQLVYNMVDMIVVGNFVGTEGLSAVAIGGEVLMLITFVAMGFSNAGQILISRYVGAKRTDLVGEMVGTLFTLLEGLAVIIMIIFLFTYQGIIAWLNTPDEIWEYTRQYSITCVYGVVFIYGYNLVSAILRGMGDSKHPFMFIAIASVINVVLDILFVGPMKMGPRGAALATVIGQAVSFFFALRLLYKNRAQIHFDFHPKHFRIGKNVIRNLLSLGIPMVIQSAAITFSMLFVNSYINTYGTVAVAVTGVARKLENMIGVVSQAISSAGGAMVSQALGARKTERVPKIVFHAMWIVAIPAAVFALITDHLAEAGMALRSVLPGSRGPGHGHHLHPDRHDPVPGLRAAAAELRPDQRLRQLEAEPGGGAAGRHLHPHRPEPAAGRDPGPGHPRLLVRQRPLRPGALPDRHSLPALRPVENL